MFCRNGTMIVCIFLLRCSVICKTSRNIAKILLFRIFRIFFALNDMKVFLFIDLNIKYKILNIKY